VPSADQALPAPDLQREQDIDLEPPGCRLIIAAQRGVRAGCLAALADFALDDRGHLAGAERSPGDLAGAEACDPAGDHAVLNGWGGACVHGLGVVDRGQGLAQHRHHMCLPAMGRRPERGTQGGSPLVDRTHACSVTQDLAPDNGRAPGGRRDGDRPRDRA
jgi:hypothetical protein